MTALARPTVEVLLRGYVDRDGVQVVDASSTVALVRCPGKNILVDSGAVHHRTNLLAALESTLLDVSEVDTVVNTHLHLDHCGNNDIFTEARFFAHVLESPPIGSIAVSKKEVLCPGVFLLPTPGHTRGSLTVLVNGERRYAICGDAIPTKANYDSHLPPFLNVDRKLALISLDTVVASADVIVPGHGPPFEVVRKK